ncbi:aminotransferase-like domain-containing protein, partial [Leucobacter sp. M11]|uniref:aminotransferase-like domain-containing protein n=1 Tax=Leucobacter sp. M11 TaxID=2993565 RepID=UPI002D7E9A61
PVWRRHLHNTRGEQPPEITKPLGWETQPYPFVAGQIDEREFPRLPWARALREALEPPHLFYSVRDAIDADDPELVRAIVRHVLPARGVQAEPENVLVTTGSQQGLDLLAHALSGPGSTVGVEDPGYVDARHTFLRAGARLRPFPVDGEGIVLPPSGLGVDLLYLTPSHQSPTNVTLSRPRRLDILERARASGTVVIEDDYDSEFRYQGQPSPALRAHPGAEHVIYLGSFTKFLAPGLRLGYLIADAALIRELRRLRRYRVRHLPGHSQRAMALLISSGHYQRTITRRRGALGQKWEMLRTVLGEELPWSFPVPPGGVSVWVSGPPGFDGVALTERARAHGIVIERGDVFFTRPEENRNHIRLGFAAIDLARIRPGVRRLASLIR